MQYRYREEREIKKKKKKTDEAGFCATLGIGYDVWQGRCVGAIVCCAPWGWALLLDETIWRRLVARLYYDEGCLFYQSMRLYNVARAVVQTRPDMKSTRPGRRVARGGSCDNSERSLVCCNTETLWESRSGLAGSRLDWSVWPEAGAAWGGGRGVSCVWSGPTPYLVPDGKMSHP